MGMSPNWAARSASLRASFISSSSRFEKRSSMSAPLGRADDVHAAVGVVGNLVRHASKEEAPGAGHPLVADDDEVCARLLGNIENRIRRRALAGMGVDLDPGFPRFRA